MTARMLFERNKAFSRQPIGYAKPMVRLRFLREQRLTYDARFRVGEDFLFLAEAVLKGARAFVLPSADYVYVCRVSPSAGTVAPTSRAHNGVAYRTSSVLMGRYWQDMSKAERRALARTRRSVTDQLTYLDLKAALRAGDARRAAKLYLTRPRVGLVQLYWVRNRLQNLAMIHWSRAFPPSHGRHSDLASPTDDARTRRFKRRVSLRLTPHPLKVGHQLGRLCVYPCTMLGLLWRRLDNVAMGWFPSPIAAL